MKGNYITNENISNNIMFHNSNYSLKERRNPYNHNNIMVYSLTGRRKPESKYHKVNVQQNSFQQKKEPQIAEEDIDYLMLFSQKNKSNYNNPNNRVRKSKFFYSNRVNNTKNPNQNKIQKTIQRAVSSNCNQIPQRINVDYSNNVNFYLSRRATSKNDHHVNQSKFNSSTERILGNSNKIIGINGIFLNREQQSSINRNANANVNINMNKKKIPMPLKNGYNMNPKINKIIKTKIENTTKDKTKIRNKNIYYGHNNYSVYNTNQSFFENPNLNLDISNKIKLQNSISEVASLQNIFIEDKENIIPNHNNSINFNTISNSHTRNINKPNIKLYHNNKILPKENNSIAYNTKLKMIPLGQINEQYVIKQNSNNPNKYIDSKQKLQKLENRNFYINQVNEHKIKKEQNHYKDNKLMIPQKKVKEHNNLREFIIKKKPQNDNNSNIDNKINEINLIANTNFNDFQFHFDENKNIDQSNIPNNEIIHHHKNKIEYKNSKTIDNYDNNMENINLNIQTNNNYFIEEPNDNNILNNYNENKILNDLIFDNLKSNSYLQNDDINQLNYNTQYNEIPQNSQKQRITEIPIPQNNKIHQENIQSEFTTINDNLFEENNNMIITENKLKNVNNNHFPDPEKPVRKESNSVLMPSQNSSNITYNIFNDSGWLKNYAVFTHPGVDKTGNQKTNQDSYVFKTNINGINNFNIFGVMDGHGPQGHYVSQFASKYIPFKITNHREIQSLIDPEEIYQKLKYNEYEIINQIFLETDIQLEKVNFDATESGCTCVLIIHIGSHIICANTGDSRAILISGDSGENNINNFFEVALSYDYKPEMPEEKQRIESFGGVVEQLKNKMGEGVGPYRVWAKEGGYPGLAMSRSIGDLNGKKLGIIPNPGIMEYDLNNNVKYIVVASDGIWEFLSNENVKDVGNKYYLNKDPNGFCHEIVKDAYKLWKENGITVDDITAIAAYF